MSNLQITLNYSTQHQLHGCSMKRAGRVYFARCCRKPDFTKMLGVCLRGGRGALGVCVGGGGWVGGGADAQGTLGFVWGGGLWVLWGMLGEGGGGLGVVCVLFEGGVGGFGCFGVCCGVCVCVCKYLGMGWAGLGYT